MNDTDYFRFAILHENGTFICKPSVRKYAEKSYDFIYRITNMLPICAIEILSTESTIDGSANTSSVFIIEILSVSNNAINSVNPSSF